ncbi:MAG: rhomboid family intramembrane serine protease [Akkermansiaceae bacterium]
MSGTSSSVDTAQEVQSQPVWARPDALPLKPDASGEFGFTDHKGIEHPCDSLEALAEKAGKSRDGIALVWTPESDRMLVPEEVPAMHKPLRQRRRKFAQRDVSDGARMGLVFGVALLWTLYAAWNNGGKNIESLYSHQLTGLAALLLLIFGALPFYEGWKTRRLLEQTKASDMAKEIPEARFDAWLERRSIPATWFLLGGLLFVGLIQLYIDRGSGGLTESIQQAGQLKNKASQFSNVEDAHAWWRILTAGVLHGNPIHFLMNAAGILYLGRRTEALARWPHLLIVFFAAMWMGGVASARLMPNDPAVGASGGLMGLLGFMLVFEFLHKKLVPRPARRRLLAGLILMGVMGFLGMSFIDNAAHAGGLLAGLVYAVVVFPPSASAARPMAEGKDKIVGALAAFSFLMICALAGIKILSLA